MPVPSKLGKYSSISRNRGLKPFLPRTRRLNRANLTHFLNQYNGVVIKPLWGSGGLGVIAISTRGNRDYVIHCKKVKKNVTGMESLYANIMKLTGKKPYLVQRKLSLASIDGRPIDFRVMVQRTRNSGWIVTGKLAKVASPGYFITNLARNRGTVLPFETAIKRSNIRGVTATQIHKQIDRVVLTSVKMLQQDHPIRTVGFDIGIDRFGNIWIIEPNYSPDKTMFRRLKDKTLYHRIMHYYNRKR